VKYAPLLKSLSCTFERDTWIAMVNADKSITTAQRIFDEKEEIASTKYVLSTNWVERRPDPRPSISRQVDCSDDEYTPSEVHVAPCTHHRRNLVNPR
jgi:hypothetical protein